MLIVGQRDLSEREPDARHWGVGQRTLIVSRREPTEPKAALAGVMVDLSFARFRVSMGTFSFEKVSPCSFGRWDVEAIIDARGGYKKTAGDAGKART